MKHIENLHGGAKKMMVSGLKQSNVNRQGLAFKRKLLSLPRPIHEILAEEAYLQEVSMTHIVTVSLDEYLSSGNEECHKYDFSDCINTSVRISKPQAAEIRKRVHYGEHSGRDLMCEAISRHLLTYGTKRYERTIRKARLDTGAANSASDKECHAMDNMGINIESAPQEG